MHMCACVCVCVQEKQAFLAAQQIWNQPGLWWDCLENKERKKKEKEEEDKVIQSWTVKF